MPCVRGEEKTRASITPRHAAVVAYLALFAALGGGAYAAAKINGRDLVDRSVAAKKVARNVLTGIEVNESKLGKVAAAKFADSARATRNVVKFDFAGDPVLPGAKVFQIGAGVSLRPVCNGTGSGPLPFAQLEVDLMNDAPGEANAWYVKGVPGTNSDERANETSVLRGNALGKQSTFQLIPHSSPDDELRTGSGSYAQAGGGFVYRSATHVVTGTFHAFVTVGPDGRVVCEFNGTALVS